jgi:hypothetical protein
MPSSLKENKKEIEVIGLNGAPSTMKWKKNLGNLVL